jgi:hypothetical protein
MRGSLPASSTTAKETNAARVFLCYFSATGSNEKITEDSIKEKKSRIYL